MNTDEQIKILCVDDEKNVLRSLGRILLDTDYNIFTATSGKEGLEILEKEENIQLVISDYRMPEMNGVEFLKVTCERWPDTIRIVLSGFADTASIVEAINEGQIYKFVSKPWDDDELKVTISKALEVHFLHKKNVQLSEELSVANIELQAINENLEQLVDERTADLLFQIAAMQKAQNILNFLPVAVLGIDPDGMVVQHNKRYLELVESDPSQLVGSDRSQSLPEVLNRVIDNIIEMRTYSNVISINDKNIKVAGLLMKDPDGQEGVVLALDKV